MEWYKMVLQKYAVFNGRAGRKEYWMFFLFNMLFGFAAIVLDNLFGIAFFGNFYGPLYLLYMLAVLIPALAVAVRRLHDTGKSGWWILISLVPFVGWIVVLILLAMEGEPGDNEYGPDPKIADDGYNPSGYARSQEQSRYSQPRNSSYGPQHRPTPQNTGANYETMRVNAGRHVKFPLSVVQQNGSAAGRKYTITGHSEKDYYIANVGRSTPETQPDVSINESLVSRKHFSVILKDSA
ncbi:MAG: DUF805 domain-containing protein, partial [Prolixibacteraceae bacterium]